MKRFSAAVGHHPASPSTQILSATPYVTYSVSSLTVSTQRISTVLAQPLPYDTNHAAVIYNSISDPIGNEPNGCTSPATTAQTESPTPTSMGAYLSWDMCHSRKDRLRFLLSADKWVLEQAHHQRVSVGSFVGHFLTEVFGNAYGAAFEKLFVALADATPLHTAIYAGDYARAATLAKQYPFMATQKHRGILPVHSLCKTSPAEMLGTLSADILCSENEAISTNYNHAHGVTGPSRADDHCSEHGAGNCRASCDTDSETGEMFLGWFASERQCAQCNSTPINTSHSAASGVFGPASNDANTTPTPNDVPSSPDMRSRLQRAHRSKLWYVYFLDQKSLILGL